MQSQTEVDCVAGRGLKGDRFYDYKECYKGQITFFQQEVFDSLCETLGVKDKPISAFRRNVITQNVKLNELIGKRFELQGIQFEGVEECRPCYWMDQAFGVGAEAAMSGCGGLRARILSNGTLRVSG